MAKPNPNPRFVPLAEGHSFIYRKQIDYGLFIEEQQKILLCNLNKELPPLVFNFISEAAFKESCNTLLTLFSNKDFLCIPNTGFIAVKKVVGISLSPNYIKIFGLDAQKPFLSYAISGFDEDKRLAALELYTSYFHNNPKYVVIDGIGVIHKEHCNSLSPCDTGIRVMNSLNQLALWIPEADEQKRLECLKSLMPRFGYVQESNDINAVEADI